MNKKRILLLGTQAVLVLAATRLFAQMAPLAPADSSVFPGNAFELLQRNPLPMDQEFSSIPVAQNETCSVSLVQLRGHLKAHYHAQHDEMVYILSGQGVMTVGETKRPVQAGDIISIKRNVIHTVEARSTQPLTALSIMSPPFDGQDRIFTE